MIFAGMSQEIIIETYKKLFNSNMRDLLRLTTRNVTLIRKSPEVLKTISPSAALSLDNSMEPGTINNRIAEQATYNDLEGQYFC